MSRHKLPFIVGELTYEHSKGIEKSKDTTSKPSDNLTDLSLAALKAKEAKDLFLAEMAKVIIHKIKFKQEELNEGVGGLLIKPKEEVQEGIIKSDLSNIGEREFVKEFRGCNCKKSKCLKLYCECFAYNKV